MPSQYESYGNDTTLNCSRRTLDNESYYCNEELMQLLVFDARATNQSFAGDFQLNELSKAYQVFLRFIATQSGLTRWQPITEKNGNDDNDDKYGKIAFGDLHNRAVNEPWYKGAIFQHQIDSNSVSITGNYPMYFDKKIIDNFILYKYSHMNSYLTDVLFLLARSEHSQLNGKMFCISSDANRLEDNPTLSDSLLFNLRLQSE